MGYQVHKVKTIVLKNHGRTPATTSQRAKTLEHGREQEQKIRAEVLLFFFDNYQTEVIVSSKLTNETRVLIMTIPSGKAKRIEEIKEVKAENSWRRSEAYVLS